MFTKAIVRPPGANYATGLTTVDLGAPDLERALKQHEAYCDTLESCGLNVIRLAPNEDHPDSTFVEDTAVLTARGAVITRPGAPSRRNETNNIAPVIRDYFSRVHLIEEPGTVDGGDICEAGEHFFIGVSLRTNEHGARQLAGFFESFGYSSSLIDIRRVSNILHLKSGLAYLGGGQLVLIDALRGLNEFSGYELVCLDSSEDYAANCLEINGKVLIADGFPATRRELEHRGYQTIALDMSEFQKMDGGLSCLSLRF
ncbi:MAG TPA: arginine deiminase family protein [Pyrinomonadaceae bacterium]|jgi:dimethylargininase|nr:arginine deiminase family protein [Pyrinomonadaceae bacterium]